MDEQRLTEIEAYARAMCLGKPSVLAEDMVPELIAEVRQLQAWQRDMVAWVEEMHAKYPVQR